MDVKDRERLALSTGLALVGYAIIYVLLAGLNWPTDVAVRSINAPLSVYVDLQGNSSKEPAGAPQLKPAQPEKPAPPAQPTTAEQSPTNSSNQKATTTVAPPVAAPAQSQSATQPKLTETAPPPSSSTSTASSSSAQSSTSSSSSSSQSPPSTPIPSSMTSSAGPTSTPSGAAQPQTGSAAQSGAPLSGSVSPKPGVTYPPGATADNAPPQGTGGTGSQSNQGQSKTFYGPQSSKSGSILNPLLANSAGSTDTGSSSGSTAASGSSSAAAGAQAAGQQAPSSGGPSGGGAGQSAGAGSATGTQTGGAGGSVPKIEWKGTSSTREVDHRPPKLVIPKQYLSEIPPKITLTIDFQVTPLGTVNALKVTPSLGYPQLDDLVKEWMGKWQFQPISGDQTAEGTLEYVIQANTAG